MQTNIVEEARCRVLRWFKGKACENAAAALDLLALSEAEGNWIPGASRRVRACLGKANVAVNIGRAHEKQLDAIGDYNVPRDERGFEVSMILRFSQHFPGHACNFDGVKARTTDTQLHAVIDRAREFVSDFATINALLRDLNNTRPRPTFTSIGASRLVSSTLAHLGLASPDANARVCPRRWERVEKKNTEGKVVGWSFVAVLEWPEGTRHSRSRYATGTSTHDQCHACGHAIKNPFNWVPLVLDNVNGQGTTPYSLWVGRDCAKTIFGIKMTGDFDIKNLHTELAVTS
jgi:hypothetical protein